MPLTWPILAAPLLTAVVLLGARRLGRLAGPIGALGVGLGFAASATAFLRLIALPSEARSVGSNLWRWATVGTLEIGVDLRFDPLSAVMTLVVTGVGFLITVYSIGYMHGDPRFQRFFAYINLFVFSMLLLVLGDNLLVMFAGWELVGLCSYLLIGFWNHKPSAATAAKKAFIVTRIGDTGFMIGLFLIFATVGTLHIPAVLHAAETNQIAATTGTAIALLLFAGAVGKSAQVPLYVWLPDAMEGPTPVSALIHAATMVTAGVYLVVRMGPLFEMSTTASLVVAVIGIITAVYAAVLAMAEEDIKRVLAYSTVSQLGYMFVAAGIGAYTVAIFHLATHAFFKALLFLAAGSVMHGLHDETSLERMGGLRKAMPQTFAVTAVGWIAITGILPFAGFWSKDAIVATAFADGRTVLFVFGAIGAVLTAFYMSRMLFLAFAGQPRWSEGTHPHESPPIMVIPMAVLAIASAVGGILNLPPGLPGAGILEHFLEPVVGHHAEPPLGGVSLLLWAVAGIGVAIAWAIYGAGAVSRSAIRERIRPIHTLVRNKLFVDDIYATVIVSPARLIAAGCAVFDQRVIDGAVNGVATVVASAATTFRKMQTGLVRSYAMAVFGGAAVVLAYVAVRVL